MKRRPRDAAAGPTAVDLIEESVHLLRRAPAATLLVYYAGTAPFALGLLFFWAYTTWFAPSGAELAWAALGLVALFAAMKGAHAEFCARLLAHRLGAEPPAWSASRVRRLAAAQLRWQAWGLVALPLAALVVLPFGWVYAYFQNVAVLGDADDAPAVARAQASLWPAQNHGVLVVFFGLALCAWANVAMTLWLIPWLANSVFGIENAFGLSGHWFGNTTSLASVTVLAWLAIDPLVKAFYTLRVFHGRARRTGEDVRVALRAARRPRRAWGAAAALGLLLTSAVLPPRGRAAEPAPAISAAQLDQAIDRTLAGSSFQWRLRPVPVAPNPAADGPIYRFIRVGGLWVKNLVHGVTRAIMRLIDWISGAFTPKGAAPDRATAGGGSVVLDAMLVIGIVVVGGLLAWVAVVVWRRQRERRPRSVAARVVTPAVPDLRDEATQATQLPADGWLALAREQMERGEWRLALRALQLATLARLAAEGWISLAKFKTNLDYERELRRRALAREEITQQFSARRRVFEAAWYGRAEPAETDARAWLAELERPATP